MAWMLLRLFVRHKQAGGAPYRLAMQAKRGARAVCYLLNLHTLLLLTAACAAVYLCHARGWRINLDFTLISTGTIFPLTFTLQQAFTRRERATIIMANLKASVLGLYYMHRDWERSAAVYGVAGALASLGDDDLPSAVAAKALLADLLLTFRKFLTSRASPYESLGEARLTAAHKPPAAQLLAAFGHDMRLSQRSKTFRTTLRGLVESDPAQVHLATCYRLLSQLSVLNEKLMLAAGYTKGGEGGFSRTSQYLRYILANIEELRSIKEYRTPTMMRHACGVLIHMFAMCLAPYYAHFCSASPMAPCASGYAASAAYVLIVMLLYHVQQDLENCLDETGLDDVFFTLPEELDGDAGGAPVLHSPRSSVTDMVIASVRGRSPPRIVTALASLAEADPPMHLMMGGSSGGGGGGGNNNTVPRAPTPRTLLRHTSTTGGGGGGNTSSAATSWRGGGGLGGLGGSHAGGGGGGSSDDGGGASPPAVLGMPGSGISGGDFWPGLAALHPATLRAAAAAAGGGTIAFAAPTGAPSVATSSVRGASPPPV